MQFQTLSAATVIVGAVILAGALDPAMAATKDRSWADAENSCAMVVTALVTGVEVSNVRESIAECNKHPERANCYKALAFVKQNGGRLPPEFNCK